MSLTEGVLTPSPRWTRHHVWQVLYVSLGRVPGSLSLLLEKARVARATEV